MSSLSVAKHLTRENSIECWPTTKFKVYTQRHLRQIPQLKKLSEEQLFTMEVVAKVFPFRVNNYVLNELINWNNLAEDPIFQLTFPQKDMLTDEDFNTLAELMKAGADDKEVTKAARKIQAKLNPHPAGQQELNVPLLDGERLEGMQHKYNETVLFFPSQGQVCHSYCTFCFRWAQFIGDRDLKFASNEASKLHSYLKSQPQVTDLLMTGGDPMVMRTRHLVSYLEPLLEAEFDQITTIRIGTKSLTFWPQRFVTDPDAAELLDLFTRLVKGGKHVAFMAHFNHWQEMQTPIVKEAIKRIRATGAIIRTQAPLVKHINDDAQVWAKMWRKQVALGLVPYYMFVERDTGAKNYFELPLAQAVEIYSNAIQQVSGLARTARGPSMSAGPGKVEVQGITELNGEKVFVLRFIQGRNADWVQQPFFAKYDPKATWFDDLVPAFGEKDFFFSEEYRQQIAATGADEIY